MMKIYVFVKLYCTKCTTGNIAQWCAERLIQQGKA